MQRALDDVALQNPVTEVSSSPTSKLLTLPGGRSAAAQMATGFSPMLDDTLFSVRHSRRVRHDRAKMMRA
jgi:hypothetical protein